MRFSFTISFVSSNIVIVYHYWFVATFSDFELFCQCMMMMMIAAIAAIVAILLLLLRSFFSLGESKGCCEQERSQFWVNVGSNLELMTLPLVKSKISVWKISIAEVYE